MIKESNGKITEKFYALGSPALPSYLFLGDSPVLFDSGMTVMGPLYLQDLKKYLGDPNRLTYLFLTHSHFDHAGSAPFLKKNLPRLKVAAGKAAADIFKRPSAIQLIQSLSRPMEEQWKAQLGGVDVTFRGLDLDRVLEDGDEIKLEDGTRIQVVATPGHTRDTVCYYFPEQKALIGGEKMIPKAIEATQTFGKRIEAELEAHGGNQEAVVKKIFREEYLEKKSINQDEKPFLINLTAQVKTIAARKDTGR
jgi:flavorubredoxin